MKDIKIISHKNRKAISFFLFDAVIASLVFFIAIALILSSSAKSPDIETPKFYSDNLMNYYLETVVSDVQNDYVSSLLINKSIEDPSITLLEQILIFFDKNQHNVNSKFVESISSDKIPSNYGFNITIYNKTNTGLIYSKSSASSFPKSKINLKRIVITEDSDEEIIGPFYISINMWY